MMCGMCISLVNNCEAIDNVPCRVIRGRGRRREANHINVSNRKQNYIFFSDQEKPLGPLGSQPACIVNTIGTKQS